MQLSLRKAKIREFHLALNTLLGLNELTYIVHRFAISVALTILVCRSPFTCLGVFDTRKMRLEVVLAAR